MKDEIKKYVSRVREMQSLCSGNEQATKQSLIAPLFSMLGYDLSDPRICLPEYKADFGIGRSSKPVDWAFLRNGKPIIFVEAKEVGKNLEGFDEQLADYFAKSPEVKLGILTNGRCWRFFTDLVYTNIMDKDPFIKWDVLEDEQPPYDFLTLLASSNFNPELVKTFAAKRRNQNLLLVELTRILKPSAEFINIAIQNLETRPVTQEIVDGWKPVVSAALNEWIKQQLLTDILSENNAEDVAIVPAVETTKEELETYATIRSLLGKDRLTNYQDTASYFKIHLPERATWVICRLVFGKGKPTLSVPLSPEQTIPFAGGRNVVNSGGWSTVTLSSTQDISNLGDLLCFAWEMKRKERPAN
jgi:hypothetical protein